MNLITRKKENVFTMEIKWNEQLQKMGTVVVKRIIKSFFFSVFANKNQF